MRLAVMCCTVLGLWWPGACWPGAWGLGGVARADRIDIEQGQPVLEVAIAEPTAHMVSVRETGIPLGAPLTRTLVRSAIQRLLQSERWADVQVYAEALDGGVRVVFQLQPRIVLQRVAITGESALSGDTLARALQLGPGAEVARETLPELAETVTELYAEHGYLAARADLELRDTDEPARKVLLVRITEGRPTRITDISFEGELLPNLAKLRKLFGVGKGDPLDRKRLEEGAQAVERWLREQGYLEATVDAPQVQIRTGPAVGDASAGGRARVRIPARAGPHYQARIHGVEPLTQRDVKGVLNWGAEALGEGMLEAMGERVAELYRRHGFLDAAVRVRRLPGAQPEQAVIDVTIEAGPQIRVAQLRFDGNRHFPDALLRDQVHSYLEEDLPGAGLLKTVDSEAVDAIGFGARQPTRRQVPSPAELDPRTAYYLPTYQEALKHIQELYQAEGYLGAQLGPPHIERRPVPENAAARSTYVEAVVTVPVNEGPRTYLHALSLSGNVTVTAGELLVEAALQADAPFSYLKLEEARLRILDAYRERGHLFARVEPSVHFSNDRTRAQVRLDIVEGYAVHVDEVVVRGNVRTSERLIRSLLQIQPGDVYRPSLARRSEERLFALGIFSGATVGPEDPELPARTKTLVVSVTERPGQFLDFAGGISTGQGVRAGFDYGYRNLFGLGVGLNLRVQLAYQFIFVEDELRRRYERLEMVDRLERRVGLGAALPHMQWLPGVRTSIDLVHLRGNERDFGLDKNAVGITFSGQLRRRVMLTVSTGLENNHVDLFTDSLADCERCQTDLRLQEMLRVPEGESTLVATRAVLSYDLRDNPFLPTRGVYSSISGEWARTLSTEQPADGDRFCSNFVKMTLGTSGYVPLARRVVLAGQVRVGRIFHMHRGCAGLSKTYPNRAFFLGGVDTLRGYFQDSLMPQDLADANAERNSVVRGGDAFILLRSELRFPIFGQLRGALFTDAGNLWADAAALSLAPLRVTTGVGLRLETPVGPLAFDWGFLLHRREAFGEPKYGSPHFSIGVF